MRKNLENEIFLNCILIENNVRECFLIWCKKTLNMPNFIKNNFPKLILTSYNEFSDKNNLKSCDVLLISKRVLNKYEYDTDEKLGKLLGYLSADSFNKIDKTKNLYNYYIKAVINQSEINLFGEISQNKLNYQPIKEKVYNVLKDHVDDIKIIERNFVYTK
jgi:hypothetical protein